MATLTARIKHVDGLQFVGESASGHAIVMDGPTQHGGHDTGMRPMELLLIGLGGCSGMDIASVLTKKKQPFTDIEINVKGEKAPEDPMRFTDIEIEFIVRGHGVKDEAVKRAVDLSMEKYCSVKATIEQKSNVKFTYKLVD